MNPRMKPSEVLEKKNKEYNIKFPECTVSDMLEVRNWNNRDNIALDYFGNKITYRQLLNLIDDYNKAFVSYGIKSKDVVSICLPTIPESIAIFYALNKLGAICHPILPTASKEEIANTLAYNKSKMFITLDQLYYRVGEAIAESDVKYKVKVSANESLPRGIKQLKTVKDIIKKERYREIPKDFITTAEFLAHGENCPVIDTSWYDGKIAAIGSSSGTTSNSKGILLTDYGFNGMVESYSKAIPEELETGTTFHSIVPLIYTTGLSNTVNLPIQLGLYTILEPNYNKDKYPERFMSVKPNLSIASVPHAKALIDYLRKVYQENRKKDRELLSFVKVFSTGGSHMPIPWEEELQYYLDYFGSSSKVGKGYGLSEHNSALTISTKEMLGAEGIVLPGVVLGIFDEKTGEELDFGEEGLIRAIAPGDMLGYFDDGTEREDYYIYDKNGRRWGDTNDIGRLEYKDGNVWLYVEGRKNDKIVVNGESILLSKIQAKVFESKLIDDCEVISKEQNEEALPLAHIVLKDKTLSEEEVLLDLKEIFKDNPKLEPFAYRIHDSLPVQISGKPNREALKLYEDNYIKDENEKINQVDFKEKILKKTI